MASDEVPAPAEEPAVDTGVFTFAFDSLKITTPPPPPVEAKEPEEGEEKGEEDAPAEEAEPVPFVEPVYTIKSTIEGPAVAFWPKTTPEPSEDGTTLPPLPSELPGMSVDTLPVPCDDAGLSKFLTSYLVVSLVADGASTVASARLQLNTIVSDNQAGVTLTFPEYGTVELNVYSTDDLADTMMGGAQLTVHHVEVSNLPAEWQILPKFDPAAMTAAGYHDAVRGYVEPPKTVGEDGEETENPPSQTFSVALGEASTFPAVPFGKAVWNYVPLEDGPAAIVDLTEEELAANRQAAIEEHEKEVQAAAEAAAAAAAAAAEENPDGEEEKKGGEPEEKSKEGGEEGGEEAWEPTGLPTTREVPTPRYKWSLTYPKPCPNGSVFMCADSMAAFSSASGDLAIPVTVVRFGTTTKFGDDEGGEEEPVEDKKAKGKKAKGKGKEEPDADAATETAWEVSGLLAASPLLNPGTFGCTLSTTLAFEGDDADKKASTSSAGPLIVVKVALSVPLVETSSSQIESSSSMGDVVGQRQWKPKEKPRDIAGDFRRQIGGFVEELAKMMKEGGGDAETFYNRVQTSGTFHRMKEKVRSSVQLAANSRFRQAPADGSGHQAYCSELFTALNTQLNAVLINKFTANSAVDSDLFPAPAISFEKDFELLALRAEEAAVCGDVASALSRHEDRVALAKRAAGTGDPDGAEMLSVAWNEKAMYCLKRGRGDRALECLGRSAGCLPLTPSMMLLKASALLNLGMYEMAEEAFGGALEGSGAEDGGEDLVATIHAGLCVLHSAVDELEKKTYDEDKESLRLRGLPMATFPKRDLSRAKKAKESLSSASKNAANAPPRRGGVSALLGLAELMVDHRLSVGAKRALDIALRCERNSQAKEVSRGLSPVDVGYIYGLRSRLDCEVAMMDGLAEEGLAHAEASCGADGSGPNYEALARAFEASGRAEEAIGAYEKCLASFTVPLCPLRVFLKLCLLLIDSNTDEGLVRASDVAVLTTKKFGSAMAWRLMGVALSELNSPLDAEGALQESLRVDSFSPAAWAHLALLLMDNGWGEGGGEGEGGGRKGGREAGGPAGPERPLPPEAAGGEALQQRGAGSGGAAPQEEPGAEQLVGDEEDAGGGPEGTEEGGGGVGDLPGADGG
jgi:tetratricopeptide (TPR) repeat protein